MKPPAIQRLFEGRRFGIRLQGRPATDQEETEKGFVKETYSII